MIDYKKLYDSDTPLVFTDGTDIYNDLAKKYITHKKGFFILAPSGAGKTHFIKNQKEKHWIDGDEMWMATFAHPGTKWWLESYDNIRKIDMKSDIITMQARDLGFWIMGASSYWLPPDAIVLPHLSTHKKYIKFREENNYDGGAKMADLSQVLWHRDIITSWIKKGIPKFKSIDEAVKYLSKLENN